MENILGKSQTAKNALGCLDESAAIRQIGYRLASLHFEVLTVAMEVGQSRPRVLTVAPNQLVLFVNLFGATLVTKAQHRATRLIYPQTLSLMRPGEYRLLEGHGRHASRLLIVQCPSDSLTAAEIGSKVANVGEKVAKLSTQELGSVLHALDHSEDYLELANTYYGLLARVFDHNNLFIASQAANSNVLARLCDAVVKDPQHDWTSASASAFCGYSLYHFSRIFKENMGIGFHQYLEETRVYAAANLLLQGVQSPEVICEAAGFSGRNKLSSALRSNLGLCFTDFKDLRRAA